LIISALSGGLGNQMFQYAAGKALAERLGHEIKLDTSFYKTFKTNRTFELSDVFEGNFQIASSQDLRSVLGWKFFFHQNGKWRHWLKRLPFATNWIHEKSFSYWPGIQNLDNSCFLEGNWQSESYFVDYSEEIRKDFSFRMENFTCPDLLNKIRSKNSVSIHIRRGDYTASKETLKYHGICPAAYYLEAMKIMQTKLTEPEFFVFSDEIQAAKDLLGKQKKVYFVEENFQGNNHYDMMLMSECQHNIIANSTFSWWGAWLNKNKTRIVIAPEKWFANDLPSQDLIPKSWLRI
jgi:hypothetical protein